MNGPANSSAAAAGSPASAPATPTSQLSTSLSQPPAIPDHELLRRIGVGAYGEVWLARTVLGEFRAVKIIRRDAFGDDPRPFEREFEGIRRFEPISRSDPSQIAILHVGRAADGAAFYYVMELADPTEPESEDRGSRIGNSARTPPTAPGVSGSGYPPSTILDSLNYSPRTLRSDLRPGTRLPVVRVVELGLALTQALAHLHRQGLVHRDVKPSNIIFVGGRPKLADIGLVTRAVAGDDARSIVGTEGYLAAEGPGTPQADLYALGKVLYEAAMGRDRRDFPDLPLGWPDVPERAALLELNEVIVKACAADRRERYASAEAMLADLKLLDAGKSVKRRRSVQRGWTWTWKTAAVLALMSLGFLLLKYERQRRAILAEQSLTPWEKHGTTNIAAWQAWQRALQMGNTYTTAGLSNAIQEWERATELDPNYIAAWSTLSVTMTIAVQEGHFAGTNLLPRAKVCAEKAVALNPKAGFAVVTLAQCNLALDYDFAQAEPLFRKGIALGARHWSQRNNFAWELLNQGRFAEAEQLWMQLKQEQPELANAYFGLGYLSCLAGNHEPGLALFEEAIRLQPDRPLWRSWRADFLWATNQRTAAAQDWLRQVQLGGFPFLDREADGAVLRQVLSEQGPEAFLQRLIVLAEERQTAGQFVAGFDLARLHAHAGNRAQALDHLETALAEHSGPLMSVKVNPAFKTLSDEPRFHAALRRLKLE